MCALTQGEIGSTAHPSHRRNLPPEQLLQGQQAVLEMVASGKPLDQSLRAIAEFSEPSSTRCRTAFGWRSNSRMPPAMS